MTIQYCSDLHLEFSENNNFLKNNPLIPKGEILLLAGDIMPFSRLKKEQPFFDFVADHFEHTYWIPGNHEYYHADCKDRTGPVREAIRSNVTLVNDTVVQHKDVKLICTTLWSHISPENEHLVHQAMSDFLVIQDHGKNFLPASFNRLHDASKTFLTEALKQPAQKTVVITHHVPTLMNYPEKFRASALNEAFAVELFDLIEASKAQYWIYGHHHQGVPDFKIGDSTLTSNQLGYLKYGEHVGFGFDRCIDL
ncbi:metallophosphoesterase [Chryseolinea lacunae]|uniref:Metallophosphoesterase n=1 Tax=Chryseolinea lacunae TaxID=2801331 RepID=A0ABS1KLR7_9BACT|nr:metallophosphoesterase [Chryseolinea lacunae]MBL0740396.1 metallophosphoesterase [Chryseolinea lacunae]